MIEKQQVEQQPSVTATIDALFDTPSSRELLPALGKLVDRRTEVEQQTGADMGYDASKKDYA